jgi:hypothetical protein
MPACPYCAYEARTGSLFCENCGNTLADDASTTLATKTVPLPTLTAWKGEGTTRIDPQTRLLFYVRGSTVPIVIEATNHSIFLGRIREKSEVKPDIDLTAYNGYEKGVSRLHAALRREKETLTIEDLGSANGTYVNGQSLIPGQRHVLCHGDEVRLGQLITSIYFK